VDDLILMLNDDGMVGRFIPFDKNRRRNVAHHNPFCNSRARVVKTETDIRVNLKNAP